MVMGSASFFHLDLFKGIDPSSDPPDFGLGARSAFIQHFKAILEPDSVFTGRYRLENCVDAQGIRGKGKGSVSWKIF